MGQYINEFGDEEAKRLAEKMPHKKITICNDETFFHELMILVAIEPLSNFILAEQGEKSRDADTWDKVMQVALKGFNTEVYQVTGDQGSGLVSYTTNILGVNHSPDLFHVQQDITKALSGYMARKVKTAQKQCFAAEENKMKSFDKLKSILERDDQRSEEQFSAAIKKCLEGADIENTCLETKEQAEKDAKTVRDAKKAIGKIYHPYDIDTGEKRDDKKLGKELEEQYSQIEEVAKRNDCSDKQKKKIHQSKKMVEKMKSTVSAFFFFIQAYVEGLHIIPKIKEIFMDVLIPMEYLKMVSSRIRIKEEKDGITTMISKLLDTLHQRDGPWNNLSDEKQKKLLLHAKTCAGKFQRSSSCVEGRNGYLSLLYHGFHRLSPEKLKSLTVIHNFFIKGKDGKIPAEKFFEQKPRDLFEWLLDKTSFPLRPRKILKRISQEEPMKKAA